MRRWLVMVVILASACGNGDGAPASSLTTGKISTTAPPPTTSPPEAMREGGPCPLGTSPEATIDVDGDGAGDDVYLSQRDDGGYDLVVCSDTLAASIDIDGQNKPPAFAGGFDIDGNGTRELFYSGATGHGVIYFATALIDNELRPIDSSWPVFLESGDAETPITGTSFMCDNDEIMATTFEPDGDQVRITSTRVTLTGESVSTVQGDPSDISADLAFAIGQHHDDCFHPPGDQHR